MANICQWLRQYCSFGLFKVMKLLGWYVVSLWFIRRQKGFELFSIKPSRKMTTIERALVPSIHRSRYNLAYNSNMKYKFMYNITIRVILCTKQLHALYIRYDLFIWFLSFITSRITSKTQTYTYNVFTSKTTECVDTLWLIW